MIHWILINVLITWKRYSICGRAFLWLYRKPLISLYGAICQETSSRALTQCKSNCKSSISLISLRIHFATNRSSSFARRGVREISRISFSITLGGFIFGNGDILALFHIEGTCPSRIELLKIAAIGFAIRDARSRSIQDSMLSGPGDLFFLILERFRSTFSTVMVYL